MLLMVKKVIRGGIWYVKANNNYMKDYGKIKNHYILSGCKEFIWMEMSQKLPAVDFK